MSFVPLLIKERRTDRWMDGWLVGTEGEQFLWVLLAMKVPIFAIRLPINHRNKTSIKNTNRSIGGAGTDPWICSCWSSIDRDCGHVSLRFCGPFQGMWLQGQPAEVVARIWIGCETESCELLIAYELFTWWILTRKRTGPPIYCCRASHSN